MDQRLLQRTILIGGVLIGLVLVLMLARNLAGKTRARPVTGTPVLAGAPPAPQSPPAPADITSVTHEPTRPPNNAPGGTLAAQLQPVKEALNKAKSAMAGATKKNHGGYVERAQADLDRTIADMDAAIGYANDHPELSAVPPAMGPTTDIALARIKEKKFPEKNNQGHFVGGLAGLQAGVAALGSVPGGNLGGFRDRLIVDIDVAATDIAEGFDFLASGRKNPPADQAHADHAGDLP